MSIHDKRNKQVIERLNKEFGKILPQKIPLDQPYAIHTKKDRKGTDWMAWYLIPSFEGETEAQQDEDLRAAVVGSYHSLRELVDSKNWLLVPEKDGDEPTGTFEIVLY